MSLRADAFRVGDRVQWAQTVLGTVTGIEHTGHPLYETVITVKSDTGEALEFWGCDILELVARSGTERDDLEDS